MVFGMYHWNYCFVVIDDKEALTVCRVSNQEERSPCESRIEGVHVQFAVQTR
jgi:hypothetical protein